MTNKITSITPKNIDIIVADMKKALAEVEAKHGIKFMNAGITYSAEEFRFKQTVKIDDPERELAKERETFEIYVGNMEELPTNGFRVAFKDTKSGDLMRFIGYNPKAPKFPFKGENITKGTKFKATRSMYIQHFGE